MLTNPRKLSATFASVKQTTISEVTREREEAGKKVRKQLEIDFIATMGSEKYYIQSAYAIPDEDKSKQETKFFDKVKEFQLDANSLEC